jgi:hypothetical protein
MRGRKNPPLDLTPAPDGTPLTFDTMATAYLQDYQLEHNEYVRVRTQLPRSYQDVLDFAYYSGCRLASAEPESVRDVTQRDPAGSDGLKLMMKMSAK